MSNSDQKPSVEIPSYAFELINSIAKKEGFIDYTLTPTAGSNHGDGFLGIMYRLTVEGQRTIDGTVKHDHLSLICKMPPDDKKRREMFNTTMPFEKEVYVYDNVLPAMIKFQEEKGISREDGFFQFPKCYGTFADPENGDFVLVMEDLKVAGYEMWNKFDTLTYAHAKLALTQLGRYHGISFGLRDQRPKVFNEFRKYKPELMLKMMENEVSRKYSEENFDRAADTLEPEEKEMREKFLTLKTTHYDKMIECCDPTRSEPFNVMNHGDFWNNNMMYQYKEGSRQPQIACLIDWQIAQFCSPAMDLGYFFYSSTEKSLRDQHYDDLLRVYYNSLAEMLSRLGSDAEKLFSYDDLQNQLKEYVRYGLLMAPMLLQIITAKPADIPDLNELAQQMSENDLESFDGFVKKDDPVYRARMGNVIRHFFEHNYDL